MTPLLYIGLSQAFFAAFIIFTKKPRYLPDTVLALWLLIIVAETTLSVYLEINPLVNLVLNIAIMLLLSYMPFMYLYARTIISESPRVSLKALLHFAPVLIFLIIVIVINDEVIFYGQVPKWSSSILLFRIVFSSYFLLALIYYSVRILRLIREHQKIIKDRFSYTSEMLTLNWLKFVLFLFIVGFIGLFTVGMLLKSKDYPFDPRLFTRVALTIFAFGVSYFGVKQPTLYKPSTTDNQVDNSSENEKAKYQRSGLSDKNAAGYVKKLSSYMESAKPYLDPELTIKDLADHLSISRHHITQVINERLNKNFFQWINDYRIEEVKKRLLDPKLQHFTIVALAYDCGFNSKSAFNAIFKKSVGRTPSEYRRVQT